MKYPTINCKETALKFIAISLKALNPNKDEVYRKKYMDKLQVFLKHCNFSETISKENSRKSNFFRNPHNIININIIYNQFKFRYVLERF